MRAGGKERRLTELMKVLVTRNISCELAVMSKEVHYEEVFSLGVPVHYLIRTTKKDIRIFSNFYAICKRFKPDIIHCWDSMTAIYSLPASRLLRIPLVNSMITDVLNERGRLGRLRLRSRISFPLSKLIIGNSHAGLMSYNAPKNKSVCIHNGFNFQRTSANRPVELTRDALKITTPFVVGMVASFSELKDYKTYLAAAQTILAKRKDVTFLCIGANTDGTGCSSLTDKKYEPWFRFLGKRRDVESLIDMMDIGVLSSFSEGISNAILEYMALGKPVIATNCGGTPELLQDNITGFLVNVGDATDISDKLALLLSDQTLRERMGAAGRKRIEEFFTIQSMADQYISAYSRIIKPANYALKPTFSVK